jgi:hypothetical protein
MVDPMVPKSSAVKLSWAPRIIALEPCKRWNTSFQRGVCHELGLESASGADCSIQGTNFSSRIFLRGSRGPNNWHCDNCVNIDISNYKHIGAVCIRQWLEIDIHPGLPNFGGHIGPQSSLQCARFRLQSHGN